MKKRFIVIDLNLCSPERLESRLNHLFLEGFQSLFAATPDFLILENVQVLPQDMGAP